MTLSTRSRIFCGQLDLKTAPRFSGCDPLAFAVAGSAFFRPLLGGGGAAAWLEPASGIAEVVGWLGTDACFARDTRVFFGAGGLGNLSGTSEEAVALAERRGLTRVLFETTSGGSAWPIVIWDWSGGVSEATGSSLRFRFLTTIF